MNSGTWIVTPFESFAGLVLAVFVAPRMTGEVCTTVSSTTDGSSMPTGRPFSHSTWMCISRSEEHTSELQSQSNLVCRLLLEKKKKKILIIMVTQQISQHNTIM